VDRAVHRRLDRALLVDRRADDVHDAAQRAGSDRRQDRAARVGDRLAAGQALGGVHGDGADHVLTQVLGDLEHEGEGLARLLVDVLGFQRRQNGRQVTVELHVHDGADHLGDAAVGDRGGRFGGGGRRGGLGRLGRGGLAGRGLLGGGGVGHRCVPFGKSCRVGCRIRALRRRR
jgi:hypothetical protein